MFCWGGKQEEDIHTSKEKLSNAPIVSLPQGIRGFIVYSDASKLDLAKTDMTR